MIAVLIASSKEGKSCWVNVRSAMLLRIRGMAAGDKVRIHFDNGSENYLIAEEENDCDHTLPQETSRVMVEHTKAGEGCIFVDLR